MIKIKYKLIYTGYCTHAEWVTIKGGSWGKVPFPAMCALLEHPSYGNIIFDTGYTQRFFDSTKRFPDSLYGKLIPVFLNKGEDLVGQLKKQDVDVASIRSVILSHFHADHMCGLKDFTEANYICSREGYKYIEGRTGFSALTKGFLPMLLPADFDERASYIEDTPKMDLPSFMSPFTGHDILGDGSIWAIDLPGHARAQFGIFFYDHAGDPVFFISDSSWSSKAYREYLLPSLPAYLIMDSRKKYNDTLAKLHQLHQRAPEVRLIPSHCREQQAAHT